MITIDITEIEKIIKNLRLKYIFIFILISLIFPGMCTFIVLFTQDLSKSVISVMEIIFIAYIVWFITLFLFFGIPFLVILNEKYSVYVKQSIIKIVLEAYAYSDLIIVEECSDKPKGLFKGVQFYIDGKLRNFVEDFYIHLSRGFIDVFMCELTFFEKPVRRKYSPYADMLFGDDMGLRRLIGVKIISNTPKYSVNSLNLVQVLPKESQYKTIQEELYVIVPLEDKYRFNIFTRTNYQNFMDEILKIFDLVLNLRFPNM